MALERLRAPASGSGEIHKQPKSISNEHRSNEEIVGVEVLRILNMNESFCCNRIISIHNIYTYIYICTYVYIRMYIYIYYVYQTSRSRDGARYLVSTIFEKHLCFFHSKSCTSWILLFVSQSSLRGGGQAQLLLPFKVPCKVVENYTCYSSAHCSQL